MRVLRRVWGAPLWTHVAALAILLVALVPVIGSAHSFSPDEAVALTQARSLSSGGGWAVEHPFPAIDPDDQLYPLAGSSRGDHGIAPFGKHPLYPLVLAGLDQVGGTAAMVLFSVLGTVGAAGCAALLAQETTGGRARPVLWAVGLASPLLFDAYLLMAHSTGAALATAALLVVVKATGRPRAPAPMVGAAALVVAAVLLRSEALLFALALAAGMGMVGLARRRWSLLAWGAFIGAAGIASASAEKQLLAVLIGSDPTSLSAPDAGGAFWEARLAGFLNTWLAPSLEEPDPAAMLLVVVVVLALAAVGVLLLRPQRPHMLVLLGTLALALTAVAVVARPDRVVPGLLVAYPLAVFGIGLIDRAWFGPARNPIPVITAVLFMVAVLATQYGAGGSAEWGGRYFALAVPTLTVLAIDGLSRRSAALPPPLRRRAGGALAGCAALLAVGAVVSLARHHDDGERILADMAAVTATTAPSDGGAPVVVTAWANIARFAWPNHSDDRWLLADPDERGAELAERLAEAGVGELVVVAKEPEEVEPYLARYRIDPDRSRSAGPWEIAVLVPRS